MTTLQKIEELNKACGNSLGLQCYCDGWEVSSFKDGSPLELGMGKKVMGKTIKEAISKAYKLVIKSK